MIKTRVITTAIWRHLAAMMVLCWLLIPPVMAQDKIDQRMGETPLEEEDEEPRPENWRDKIQSTSWPTVFFEPVDALKAMLNDNFQIDVYGQPIHIGISGRFNPAVLYGDNSEDTAFSLVDNNNASTNIIAIAETGFAEKWILGGRIKVPLVFRSSVSADFDDSGFDFGSGEIGEYELSGYVDRKDFGRLSIGYGSTASDGTAEADLSGTIVISRSRVRDLAGGFSFQNDGPQIGDVFRNYDGLGDDSRYRYDSPDISGWRFAASHTSDNDVDFAVRWQPELTDRRVLVAAGFAKTADNQELLSMSASVLLETGVNFTAAISGINRDDRSPFFAYGKIGWLGRPFEWGPTAFAADISYNADSAEKDDEAYSLGLFAVQTLEKDGVINGLDFYAGIRLHHYETKYVNYEEVFASMTGVRIRF